MKLFGQLVRTGLNLVTLPVAVAKDVVTVGNFGAIFDEDGKKKTFTEKHIEKIKEEAKED